MTIRILVRIDDANMAAHVGGPVVTSYRTFDIIAPELEEVLLGGGRSSNEFSYRSVCGAEVIAPQISDDHQ